jgi:hypothetical protein
MKKKNISGTNKRSSLFFPAVSIEGKESHDSDAWLG